MTAREIAVLRELLTLMSDAVADRKALITILEESGPSDWGRRLEELRQTPEYGLIKQRYELAGRQLELDTNFEDLARLYEQLNAGKPLN